MMQEIVERGNEIPKDIGLINEIMRIASMIKCPKFLFVD
jgi:hypothetical protein